MITGVMFFWPLWLVAIGAPAQEIADRAATLKFLQSCRAPDGGFSSVPGPGSSTLSATSAAVRAVRLFGGTIDQPERVKRFVWSCYNAERGMFGERPAGQVKKGDEEKNQAGKSDLRTQPYISSYRSTAMGIMALMELKVKVPGDEVKRWLAQMGKAAHPEEIRLGAAVVESLVLEGLVEKVPAEWEVRLAKSFEREWQPDGTYGQGAGQACTTAGYSAAFLRLGFPVGDKNRLRAFLLEKQLPGGGWGNDKGEADLESTYRVMRCLYLLRVKDGEAMERCRKFVLVCRKADGGYGNPGGASAVATTYFAGAVLKWVEELSGR